MKILRITESQYKRLVRNKNLNEQFYSVPEKDSGDLSYDMIEFLSLIADTVNYNYGKNIVVKDIKDGVIYFDWSEFTPEEKDYVLNLIKLYVDRDYSKEDSVSGDTYFSGRDWDWEEDRAKFTYDPEDWPEYYGKEDIVDIPKEEDYQEEVVGFDIVNNFALDGLSNGEKIILQVISDAEAKGHSYDSHNPGKIIDGLSDLSMAEVNKRYPKGAKGRYQFMPGNFGEFTKNVGLEMSDIFSPENQDKMALYLFKSKMGDCLKLEDKLVRTWAGLPVLYPRQGKEKFVKRGESYYEGMAGNTAIITPSRFESALASCGCNLNELNKKLKTKIKKSEVTSLPSKLNFHSIPNSTNYRSGQPTISELEYIINNYGIKNIVRMNGDSESGDPNDGNAKSTNKEVLRSEEKELAEGLGVNFQFINAHNAGATDKIQKILNKGNTLIHCLNGADRTGGQVGKYLLDKGYGDEQKIWDYTTQYNGWCSKSDFWSGYQKYAKEFISDLDKEKYTALCKCDDCEGKISKEVLEKYEDSVTDNNVNSFRKWINDNKEIKDKVVKKLKTCCKTKGDPTISKRGSKTTHTKIAFSEVGQEWLDSGGGEDVVIDKDKINILVIGDSQSAGLSGKYHHKLDKDKYSVKNTAEESAKTLKMLSTLENYKKDLSKYDVVIIFGGGNDGCPKCSAIGAKSNLDKMFNIVKESDATLIAISNPTKKNSSYHKKWVEKTDEIGQHTEKSSIPDHIIKVNSNLKDKKYFSDGYHLATDSGQEWIYTQLKSILDKL